MHCAPCSPSAPPRVPSAASPTSRRPIPSPLTPRAFGPGSLLAITIESTPPGAKETTRYQGLVGLEADSLAEAFEGYFEQSEQLPTRILLASQAGRAAGLMLQKLPGAGGDSDGWNRCNALFETLQGQELAEQPVRTLLWRLFHEEGVKVLGSRPLRFACSCSRERVEDMLRGLGEAGSPRHPRGRGGGKSIATSVARPTALKLNR